jgi:8-oxo-dGTP diphosphatase
MQAGRDYIGVGVGALLFDSSGRIFLTQRGPKAKNERGKWEIPGGAVEFGETCADAAIREVFEEYGIKIKVLKMLQLCDHIIPDEKQHWLSPTYVCEIVSGTPEIKEPEKCTAIGWFTLEEAQHLPLSIVTQHDINTLLKQHHEP